MSCNGCGNCQCGGNQDLDLGVDIPDLEGAQERVDQMRSGGGEIVEDSGDDCEGGACKI